MAAGSLSDRAQTRRRLGSRAGFTLVDQAISSLGNAGLSILIAREVDADAFGAFGVAFVAFTFVIGIARAVVTDPLVIRYSTATPAVLRRRAGDSAGASLLAGIAAGVVCAAVGWVLGGQLAPAFYALAVSLPGILVQDAWRHAFFASGRPAAAAANDLVYTTVQFAGIGVAIATGHASVLAFMLAWGLGGLAGAVMGAVQVSAWPRPRASVGWLQEHRDLGVRLGLDFIINMGAVNGSVFAVGAIAGLAAAGSLRAAQTLLGPLQVLFFSLAAFVIPTFAQLAQRGRHRLLTPAVAISSVTAAIACAWVVVLMLLPQHLGEALLGASWEGARRVLLGMGIVTIMVAVATGAALTLKALGQASKLLTRTIIQSSLILVFALIGAVEDGARGAAIGLAAAHVVGAALMWAAAIPVVLRDRPRPRRY